MSVTGIASSILSSLGGGQSDPSPAQKIRGEFKQLGQDLQSGNLTQAQSDFATLSQNLSGLLGNGGNATNSTAPSSPGNSPIVQEFAKLGTDLQAGNLQTAQQDFTAIQQNASQGSSQTAGHHRHHYHVESQDSSSSGQQSSSLAQDFSQLANSLKSGNLSAAQSAFVSLQNDLQQIGGFSPSQAPGAGSVGAPATTGTLSVSA